MSDGITAMSGVSVLALYKKPVDTAAFEAYYKNTHAPLAKTMPGLRAFTVGHGGPNDSYYMVAILNFDSQAALETAMGSPQGAATVADLQNFAQAGVEIVTFANAPG